MRTRTRRAVERFNACVLGLRSSPRFGKAVSRSLTVVTYTGRRSGTTFSIPVGYRRAGDVVTIGVRFPDAKGWWRNFTGDGAPLTVRVPTMSSAPFAAGMTRQRDLVPINASVLVVSLPTTGR
jgi:hypothetical protein